MPPVASSKRTLAVCLALTEAGRPLEPAAIALASLFAKEVHSLPHAQWRSHDQGVVASIEEFVASGLLERAGAGLRLKPAELPRLKRLHIARKCYREARLTLALLPHDPRRLALYRFVLQVMCVAHAHPPEFPWASGPPVTAAELAGYLATHLPGQPGLSTTDPAQALAVARILARGLNFAWYQP